MLRAAASTAGQATVSYKTLAGFLSKNHRIHPWFAPDQNLVLEEAEMATISLSRKMH
jgi:hypothetical protein